MYREKENKRLIYSYNSIIRARTERWMYIARKLRGASPRRLHWNDDRETKPGPRGRAPAGRWGEGADLGEISRLLEIKIYPYS